MDDQCFDRPDFCQQQRRDVPVTSEFPPATLSVAEHQVWGIGPWKPGMTGEQCASADLFSGSPSGGASELRGSDDLGRINCVPQHATKGGIGGSKTSIEDGCRSRDIPH